MATYRYVEHTADLGFEVEASDRRGVWDASARALCGVMTDPEGVEPATRVVLRAEGIDLTSAWVESLAELLVQFDLDGLLLSAVGDLEVRETEGATKVRFEALGEPLDTSRHVPETLIKAVTHHGARLERTADGRWKGRVLLDL